TIFDFMICLLNDESKVINSPFLTIPETKLVEISNTSNTITKVKLKLELKLPEKKSDKQDELTQALFNFVAEPVALTFKTSETSKISESSKPIINETEIEKLLKSIKLSNKILCKMPLSLFILLFKA
ncbi:10162_t:CDS:2, partial [Cetraspora pellucida]